MDGMDKFQSDMAAINARVDQLIAERMDAFLLLAKFAQIMMSDGNRWNDEARKEFLRTHPEFIGYANSARALLARAEDK